MSSDNRFSNILSSWISLEILSPQTFRKPEHLCGGDLSLVVPLSESTMPWNNPEASLKPHTKLYYQIIIGSINMKEAISQLSKKYNQDYSERRINMGEAILATIVVDSKGYLCSDSSLAISSFAWGLGKVLKGELTDLKNWSTEEEALTNSLKRMISSCDDEGYATPITWQSIQKAYKDIIELVFIPLDMTTKTCFAIKQYESIKNPEPPAPLLLNSFYLADLIKASQLINNNTAPYNLKKYLGYQETASNAKTYKLEEITSPSFIPVAKWPNRGSHPLVLLQQAAVNIAFKDLRYNGIVAVNGPPGTGKTTLMRDIIAQIIVDRAIAMSRFDDPEKAFEASGKQTKVGNSSFNLYKLDNKLKGFEILIASSNNKAVENISAELPNIDSVSVFYKDLRYFDVISDEMLDCKTWGLISAILGNVANRSKFRQAFWLDEDSGLAPYLAVASGIEQLISVKDPETKAIISRRPPFIVSELAPPKNHDEALKTWHKIREEFQNLHSEILATLESLEQLRIDSLGNNEASQLLDASDKSYNDIHKASPWLDNHLQDLRNKLFVCAIKIHKGFIDVAAKPLRHNLSVFMQSFVYCNITDKDKLKLLPDLWASFFLVVPTVSTTFASVDRMLGKLPNEVFGWLLIDEAGQALPQSAVGAIMKTKRSFVVGDPMQIEPLVSLPQHLTQDICKEFNVNSSAWSAPEASVQSLADRASNICIEESNGMQQFSSLKLLVHRRCQEPMFGISNSIAYQNLMVQDTHDKVSLIKNILGNSRWFDIAGLYRDKWSPEEGDQMLELMLSLRAANMQPDLYVVTPFVIVAENLRKIIINSSILEGWVDCDPYKWVAENIGTVHTIQGREADAVILVLGAGGLDQEGARIWAAAKPNLLNVAVTRAKGVFYVIGNKALWGKISFFQELSRRIS